jgi:hypothetical protein
MADVRTLVLLEALDGVAEHCPKYQPVAMRNTWDDEAKRLQRESQKHEKRANKV